MTPAGSQGDASISESPLIEFRRAVAATAASHPERVALADADGSRSYAELAGLLEDAGGGRRGGRRVLGVGRSLADVEAILSASCAGESLLLLDSATTAWELERAEGLFVAAGDESSDAVILGLCSSGSSGLPKVVELDWDSVLLNAASFAAAAGYGEGDVLLCTTPLAHLYCLGAGVLGGLLRGASVHLGKGLLEPEELVAAVQTAEPTVLLSVPFLFRRYVETLRGAPEIAEDWRLRSAIAAGEPVPPELIAAWREAAGTDLRSHYGLTEGGQITLATGGEDEGVGAPLPDVEVRIGAGGEVAVRRREPGRPYRVLGQEPDPEGWYETGDLGHLDETGNLHIDGRADSRINVAGKKVDPVEVEERLLECDGVEDCAVASVESPDGVEIVAFHVGGGDDAAIRAQLAQRLSPHKLPRRFVGVAEVPRTLTGKVKRGQLIAGLAGDAPPQPRRETVAGLLERVRAEAASVVLGHPSAEAIAPERSFKELGFDSLAAVSLCERLAAITGLQLPATAVFDYPTPAALAQRLGELEEGVGDARPERPRGSFLAEPVAIVGMACRYPGGADSPQALWHLLDAGGDAIVAFPEDRGWDLERLFHPDPDHRGTSYVREGGFLGGVDRFDAEFFSIGPREALAMDPQQRLLLEAAWEAFEAGGIDPASLHGARVGVFAGVMSQDYGGGRAASPGSAEGYLTTGLSESVVSGRVSYALGLEGPAVTVNTACSSSLVATHLACQALRLGECGLAVAGGVTVMSTPAEFIEFSRQRGLAPDGRCKSFAAAADGTGFSEGAGLLVLERLSEAQRNGHRVWATIRGSAVNQDGASNGLTAPNGPSQERVIRQALANAGLKPADVDAVEAHGTGTALGDPIEAGALIAAYGQDREQPLRLGSVKSNIGHTQAAAGVAGVIKMVMAMREGVLPQTLHLGQPSPKVDWEAGAVELLAEPQPWQPNGRPRRAGVSSFGISGTNAHLILEEAPGEGCATGDPAELQPASFAGPIPMTLSAKTVPALRESAVRLAAQLEADPGLDPADVAHSLLRTRPSFERRAVVLGADRDRLLSGLAALAAGEEDAALIEGQARGECEPVFLFPGQGSQWQGMGIELAEGSTAFASHLRQCEEALAPHISWSVGEVLRGEPGAPSIERIEVVQPALFAVMVSLARLWQELGVSPAAVVGHSQGEIAAAHIAGGLSLEDAARLAAVRSRIIAKLAGQGGMVSVALAAEQIEPLLERWQGRVEVAAVNSPATTVVSGDRESLEQLLARCEEDGVRARAIPATIASHSAYVEELKEEVLESLAPIAPRSGEIPFHSTVTGGVLDTAELDAGYWYRNLRETVRFEGAMRGLLTAGHRLVVEVSPHPVFALAVQQTAEAALEDPTEATVIGTLRREEGGSERFAFSLAQAHVAGAPVRWGDCLGGGVKTVSLPTYPFQRKRYWLDVPAGAGDLGAVGLDTAGHPLLGASLAVAGEDGRRLFSGRLSRESHPWLGDHAVFGTALVPGTAFVELAHRAGVEVGAETIEELIQEQPLILPEDGGVQIQLSVTEPDEEGRCAVAIHSRPSDDSEWVRNASATLSVQPALPAADELGAWPPRGAEQLDVARFYEDLAETGFDYGPAFQGLRAAWRRGEEIFAEVELQEQPGERAEGFAIHPALLDSALQTDLLASAAEDVRLPFSWRGVTLASTDAEALRVRLSPAGADGFSLIAADEAGLPVVSIEKLTTRPLGASALGGGGAGERDALFRVEWVAPERPPSRDDAGGLAVLGALELPDPGARRYADLAALERAIAAGEDVPGTVLFECVDASAEGGEAPAAVRKAVAATLAQLQAWLTCEPLAGSRLVGLARGAVAAAPGEAGGDLSAAAAWGLLRSAQSEHPGRVAAIDLDRAEASSQALVEALTIAEEPELAIRRGEILVPRLVRALPAATPPASSEGEPWRLDIAEKGTLENLEIVSCPEVGEPLGPTEVRVGVRAAGLNFRDVVVALGLVQSEDPMGGEGAGVVLEVGAEVDDLAPGDRVMGLLLGLLARLRSPTARPWSGCPRAGRSRRRPRCRSQPSPPITACSTSPVCRRARGF